VCAHTGHHIFSFVLPHISTNIGYLPADVEYVIGLSQASALGADVREDTGDACGTVEPSSGKTGPAG
jgi:hypothetical protein